MVSPQTWREARAWAPSLVHPMTKTQSPLSPARGVCLYVTKRGVVAGGSRNKGGGEPNGFFYAKWGLGARSSAPLTMILEAGPQSWPRVCQGVNERHSGPEHVRVCAEETWPRLSERVSVNERSLGVGARPVALGERAEWVCVYVCARVCETRGPGCA